MDKQNNASAQPGVDQKALWNGSAGRAWVHNQRLLDQLLSPFEALLSSDSVLGTATRVLDVGCGTGATTLAIARRLGAQGTCAGIDLSAPMIAAARARAGGDQANVDFFAADAQTHAFEPADFDLIVSRFGVMFFDDPVQAFANLRHAARENARLAFIAWRCAEENPFMTTAERLVADRRLEAARKDEGDDSGQRADGQDARGDEALVEGAHDVLRRAEAHEERADDRG